MTVAQASWGIAVGVLIVMILTISETTVTDVLGIRTFGEESRTQFALHGPWQATALALPLIILNLFLGWALYHLVESRGAATVEGFGRPALQFDLRRASFPLSGLCLVLLTAFFLSPLRRS